MSTKESNIIDATQNAVIEAVESVSDMLENHSADLGHGHEVFYLSAEFWVAMAFVLTVLLLARPIYKAVNGMITKRIEYISRRLANAAEIKDDAETCIVFYYSISAACRANFHALRHISSTVWVASQPNSILAFSASAQNAGRSPSRRGPTT